MYRAYMVMDMSYLRDRDERDCLLNFDGIRCDFDERRKMRPAVLMLFLRNALYNTPPSLSRLKK